MIKQCVLCKFEVFYSISEMCYKGVNWEGKESLIPKSVVMAEEWCDAGTAVWVQEWFAKKNGLVYSYKNTALFKRNKKISSGRGRYSSKYKGDIIAHHIPEEIYPVNPKADEDLKRG